MNQSPMKRPFKSVDQPTTIATQSLLRRPFKALDYNADSKMENCNAVVASPLSFQSPDFFAGGNFTGALVVEFLDVIALSRFGTASKYLSMVVGNEVASRKKFFWNEAGRLKTLLEPASPLRCNILKAKEVYSKIRILVECDVKSAFFSEERQALAMDDSLPNSLPKVFMFPLYFYMPKTGVPTPLEEISPATKGFANALVALCFTIHLESMGGDLLALMGKELFEEGFIGVVKDRDDEAGLLQAIRCCCREICEDFPLFILCCSPLLEQLSRETSF